MRRSLRRLGTDRIDVYQCHVGALERGVAEEVVAALEDLRAEGLIRGYGASVDTTEHVEGWLGGPGTVSVQHRLNVLEDAPDMLALCEQHGLASLNRSPLATGLLSGKFSAGARLPRDDVRASGAGWLTAFDADGRPRAEWLEALAAIRECLTEGGRTLVQGALAWIWGRSPVTIPIPGFKTVAQAEENAGALAHAALSDGRMREIEELLERAERA